jgi:hypothetical protein
MTIYRQGDVLLRKSRKGKDLKPLAPVQGRVILAYGEVTGHCHALDAALAELFEDKDGRLYLRAEAGATLTHEEHAAIALPPGWYEVVRQREYHPEAIRRVSD